MPQIRINSLGDIDMLLDIWERSVRPSHKFLPEPVIAELKPQVRDILATSGAWVADINSLPAAFMILVGDKIEGLFVDPDHMGQGLGTRLICHAQEICGNNTAMRVDVNEQNPGGLAFYLGRGFKQMGRSPVDGWGRPYPILHLILEQE